MQRRIRVVVGSFVVLLHTSCTAASSFSLALLLLGPKGVHTSQCIKVIFNNTYTSSYGSYVATSLRRVSDVRLRRRCVVATSCTTATSHPVQPTQGVREAGPALAEALAEQRRAHAPGTRSAGARRRRRRRDVAAGHVQCSRQ
jgi:hypothetical protein